MSFVAGGACPSGWESFSSSCYYFATDPEMSQNDAYKDCKSRNKVNTRLLLALLRISLLITSGGT